MNLQTTIKMQPLTKQELRAMYEAEQKKKYDEGDDYRINNIIAHVYNQVIENAKNGVPDLY